MRVPSCALSLITIALISGTVLPSHAFTVDIYATPSTSLTGTWWNSAESGWGVLMDQQYGTLFAAYYTYDTTGLPTWYSTNCTISGDSCSGLMYQSVGGQPLTQTWGTTVVSSGLVGNVTFKFSDTSNATMNYMVNGESGSKSLSKLVFGVPSTRYYSLPADISKVSYPSSYKVITTDSSDITSDPCQLDYTVVTYPQSWMGTNELPPIKGAPFSSNFKLGMFMKDIMLTDNPSFNRGCKGSLKSEFDKTITRLKKLGVEYAYIPQWHWIGVNADSSWYIIRSEDSFGPLSDSDLSHFVKAAHASGIKVMMMNQIQGLRQSNGNSILPDANPTNYRKWFDAYQAYILERAPYFQSLGIDVWELGCNACVFMDHGTGSSADQAFFAAEYQKLLPQMKQLFKGQLAFGAGGASWLINTPSILDNIDIVVTGVWDNNFVPSASQPFTIGNFKANLNTNATQFDRAGKTVLVTLGMQSRANWFSLRGYMEETGCVSSMGNLNMSDSGCIERDTSPDFSMQAIYYEAVFEYLSSLTFKGNVIVAPGDMWETDSMISIDVFPNIAATIRNKPAEGIVKSWFAR